MTMHDDDTRDTPVEAGPDGVTIAFPGMGYARFGTVTVARDGPGRLSVAMESDACLDCYRPARIDLGDFLAGLGLTAEDCRAAIEAHGRGANDHA